MPGPESDLALRLRRHALLLMQWADTLDGFPSKSPGDHTLGAPSKIPPSPGDNIFESHEAEWRSFLKALGLEVGP